MTMQTINIKPENIAFSPFFQEYVFIDFGLSIYVCTVSKLVPAGDISPESIVIAAFNDS
jgi:serine/threonine protein kinase